MSLNEVKKTITYSEAGVDIQAGSEAVALMKQEVESTHNSSVLGGLGGFGGLFSLEDWKHFTHPVLVSGTDGVGTKLRLAILMNKHDTIGQDCVAMSVNDILVQGARPLFFLDYVAVGKLEAKHVAEIVGGVARACKQAGCALLGGETAEMPGFYAKDDYDVAGFAVGIVDREKVITGQRIEEGDVILALPSLGVHSNGFSLVRKIVLENKGMDLHTYIPELESTLGEELLTPTRLYPHVVLPLLDIADVKGMVHITGGGFYENIPRILPKGVSAHITLGSWPILPIFSLLASWGPVDLHEMFRTFNMGVGMILVVSPKDAEVIKVALQERDEPVYEIGYITARTQDEGVYIEGL